MHTITRRTLLSGMGLATAASVLPGFGARAQGKPIRIGHMIFDTSVPFYTNLIKKAHETAQELGVTLDLQGAKHDLSGEIAIVQQFTSQKVDAMLVTASNPVAIGPVITQVNQAGIPVFAVNLPIDTSNGVQVVTYVGVDDYQFGRKQGELLVKTVGPKAKIGYIVGFLGVNAVIQREKGLRDVLADHPGIEIVEKQSANWDNSQSLAITQDYLSKYPAGTLDAIVGQGPDTVTGANFAKQINRTDVKFIVGDFPADVKAAIAGGTVVGSVDQDPAPQGEFGVRDAVAWLKGDKSAFPQPNHYLPLPTITKENVDQFPAAWG